MVLRFAKIFKALLPLPLAAHFQFYDAMAADRVELSSLQNQFSPAISDKPPEELGRSVAFAAGLEDGNMLSFQQKTSSPSNIDHYHYEQLFRGVPIWGERVTISRNQENQIVRYSGVVMRGLAFDVQDAKAVISGEAALQRAKDTVRQGANIIASDFRPENENVRLVVYVRPSDKKAFLSYEVSFFAVTDRRSGKATRPFFLIDAKTGDVLHRYEGLTNEDGTGPGGNPRTGKYFYGRDVPAFEVQSVGAACRMETKDVMTINLNNQTTAPDSPYEFACRENTYKESNGGYAPLNDAHYFAGVALNMYRQWYGLDPIKGKVLIRIHYAQEYQNAFWDGKYVTFGDGGPILYPLVSLDLVAHEISHGFTEQHSKLIYTGQAGSINEAFSDMAGEAAKSFAAGAKPSDFLVGSKITKGNGDTALRYMCDPARDGRSIASVTDFKDDLDVHYGSGVYNKVFCTLAKTAGWDVRRAFSAFLAANRDYWSPNTDFVSGARDVVHAAQDAGYAVPDVVAAFGSVGIVLDDAPPVSSAISSQSSPQGSYRTADARPSEHSSNAAVPAEPAKNSPPPEQSPGEKEMVGEWLIPDSGEILTIKEGGQWFHSKYGRARIREANDESDFKVYYTNGNARCSYRVSWTDSRKTLNLIATDPMQDRDLCPEGSLQSVQHKHER